MKYYNLQHYVDKMKNGEKFSLIRFGDGEMLCIRGVQGENCDGTSYSPKLRKGLISSTTIKDPQFIYGMQRVMPDDKQRFERMFPEIDWHDSEFLADSVAKGELYPFIEQLKKMKTIIIGNKDLKKASTLIGAKFIEIPDRNAYDTEYPIKEKLKDTVVLFSAGMSSNPWIAEHWDKDNWYIDVGHIWDGYVGKMIRTYLSEIPKDILMKNYDR